MGGGDAAHPAGRGDGRVRSSGTWVTPDAATGQVIGRRFHPNNSFLLIFMRPYLP